MCSARAALQTPTSTQVLHVRVTRSGQGCAALIFEIFWRPPRTKIDSSATCCVTVHFVPTLFLGFSFPCSVVVSPLDGIFNITGPAATQITGWHYILFILPYCTIALRLFVAFYYALFYCLLFIFSDFSLRATMLINLNLNLKDTWREMLNNRGWFCSKWSE